MREGDLTVTVTNTTRNWTETTTVDNNGEYDVSKVDPGAAVAETGDVLSVNVTNDAGGSVGSATHTLTIEDLQTARVDINIMSEQPAEVRVFAIEGDVVNTDGSPAGAGLPVSIRLLTCTVQSLRWGPPPMPLAATTMTSSISQCQSQPPAIS